jgi:hypothetical protein
MILRLWRGWTSTEASSTAYRELLTGQIAPAILARGISGLRDLTVWRRDPSELGGPGAEILTAMTFDDRDAIATFTGGDPTRSVVPEEARRLLARFDELPALHRRRPLRLVTVGSFTGVHDSLSMTVFVSSIESNLRCHESCGQR